MKFLITKKLTRKEADRAILGITRWFEHNPSRRVCRTDYGWSVRRGHVAEDIDRHTEPR
jgi:hypothetical protein